jgi:chromosome segregation protein
MVLKSIELAGFKSFAKKTTLFFDSPVTGIVGPNGSGKSNIVEAIRFVLGEQSIKSLRGKGGTDLIFKGSKQLAPLNRASVTIVFDNRKKLFTFADSADTKAKMLSYDEVRITRVVYADGANSYLINDTEVRLKDIIELLSSVNIGSSGHHIISQGEADRILSANARDRRSYDRRCTRIKNLPVSD